MRRVHERRARMRHFKCENFHFHGVAWFPIHPEGESSNVYPRALSQKQNYLLPDLEYQPVEILDCRAQPTTLEVQKVPAGVGKDDRVRKRPYRHESWKKRPRLSCLLLPPLFYSRHRSSRLQLNTGQFERELKSLRSQRDTSSSGPTMMLSALRSP